MAKARATTDQIEDVLTETESPQPRKQHLESIEVPTELLVVNSNTDDILEKYALPDINVEIRPIEVIRWHKQTGANAFSRPVTIEAFYDSSKGGYNTGLTLEEKKYLEALTGVDLSNTFNADKPHPFWSTAAGRVKLENQTQIINISNAFNFIKYKVCKACTLVADSLQEYDEGIWFEATHYIHNEEQRVEKKAREISITRQAYKAIEELTPIDKRKLLQVLTGRSVAQRSDSAIDVGIEEALQANPEEVLTYSKMSKKKITVLAFIHDAVFKNVILVQKGGYFYGETRLGYSLNETTEYLLNPKNQELSLVIRGKLESLR